MTAPRRRFAPCTGADSLGFLPLKILHRSPRTLARLCDGCFTGNYPIRL